MNDMNIFFSNIEAMKGHQIISHLVFQIGVVACAEEIIFRGVIAGELTKHVRPIFVYIISSFLFSIFHFAAYGGETFPLIIAFVFGNILLLLARRFNIGAAIGLHAAYNLFIMGVTVLS